MVNDYRFDNRRFGNVAESRCWFYMCLVGVGDPSRAYELSCDGPIGCETFAAKALPAQLTTLLMTPPDILEMCWVRTNEELMMF